MVLLRSSLLFLLPLAQAGVAPKLAVVLLRSLLFLLPLAQAGSAPYTSRDLPKLAMVLLRSLLFLLPLAQAGVVPYTSRDDVSWAITRPDHLAFPYHQKLYDDYMKACNNASNGTCQSGEDFRLRMNRDQPMGVYNYTQMGFQKIRAPQELIQLLTDFWNANKGRERIEWKSVNSYHNMWDSPPWFAALEDSQFEGGGKDMQRRVFNLARPVLEEWTGMRLSPVSMYGVRIYKNNSILAPHVDRMPLVTSCIINVDQDLDEDWPLEVFDHDGIAYNVSMEPGDMVLYESHSIIHGRPFPMKGRAYVNVFLHFQPIGPLDDIKKCGPQENGLPPYIIPGGSWEKEFFKTKGSWKVEDKVPYALSRGDIRALEYQAEFYPYRLHTYDDNGWKPIHVAVYRGDLDGTKFLMEHGATIHDHVWLKGGVKGPDVLGIARQSQVVTEGHPVLDYLLSLTAQSEL